MAECSNCGAQIERGADFCPNCSVEFEDETVTEYHQTPKETKSRLAAILFALFLGGVGAHRFYLGQIGLGIVYLLFFWTGVPAIIALIDAIRFGVTTSDDLEFTQKYTD